MHVCGSSAITLNREIIMRKTEDIKNIISRKYTITTKLVLEMSYETIIWDGINMLIF